MAIEQTDSNNHFKDKNILEFTSKILEIEGLQEILDEVVNEAPRLVNCEGCAVYLEPSLVKEFDGNLIDTNGIAIHRDEINEDFVVLAAANHYENRSDKIGKHFYRAGEGLTGWVLKNGSEIFLDNIDDPEEVQKYTGAVLKDKYGNARYLFSQYQNTLVRPFLAVPLITRDGCLGVLRAATPKNERPFQTWAKELFFTFGRVISKRIEIDRIIQAQQASIENLMGLGSNIRAGASYHKRKARKAFIPIVREAQKLLRASVCSLYLLDRYGETVELMTTTDPDFERLQKQGKYISYIRGKGLIGWIFKTGKPLLVNETPSLMNRRLLSDQELLYYSDSAEINDEDRAIQAEASELRLHANPFVHFLGAPLLSSGGKTQGVLAVLSDAKGKQFSLSDLKLLQNFAISVSLFLANIRRQRLNHTLIRIGQEHGHEVFHYVVNEIPRLIWARGCSIFIRSEDTGEFRLKYTNSPSLMENKNTKKVMEGIRYNPGTGKTGLVAKLGRSLVINHYGSGVWDRKRLMTDYQRYSEDKRYQGTTLVSILRDSEGKEVALAMLGRDRAEASFTRVDEDEFYQFLDRDDSNYKILLPHEGSGHHEIESSFRSFLACPLKDKDSNIYGVIRLTRSFPGSVFTDDDLSLIRSVSNRLALSEINRLILIEREETLKKKLKIISKINSQINTSHGTEKCHLDNILRSILRAVTDMFGFEFATIQLVHHDQKTIATVDVMKNSAMPDALDPEQWKGATHPLDPPEGVKRDIHAWLLREHKEPCIIKGWDQHFDREIYTKYGHEKLIRAFVPIVTQNTQNEIGTLEAGYNIERRSFIDDEQIAMLKVLADQAAIAIRNYNQQRNLINAERLAERLQLMPDMAHILKSPAGQVSMLLTQIERELDQADSDGMLGTGRNKRRLRDYIDLAKRAVFTIETTSRTLYVEVASRIAPQKEERIEIVDALRRLINSYLYSGRIRFETTIQHGCPLLMTQSECTSLDVILLNLLDNAIKFSSPDNEVQVVCYKDDDGVCVSVTNRGLGISREDYRYIFEPGFHRLAPGWPEGTGMGLYTVKRLLDKLGWSCKVDPQMTGGARFVIRIPVGRRI